MVENLKKRFGKLEILKGIDIHIKKGEVVAVIGPSGSGKSTFLRCLNLLEEPQAGNIIIEGSNLMENNFHIDGVREKVGMVFQHFNLFPHKTVLENLMLAPVTVRKEAAEIVRERSMNLLKKV